MTPLLRVPLLLLTLLLAVPVLVTTTAAPAHACSCVLGGTQEHADGADAVFVATMLGPLEEAATGSVRADARVERVYAGDVPGDVVIETSGQSSLCGLTGVRRGEQLLFFAGGSGPTFQVGSCGGSRPADAASVAEVEQLLGEGRGAAEPVMTDDESNQVHDDGPGWLESGSTYGGVLVVGIVVALGVLVLRRRRAG